MNGVPEIRPQRGRRLPVADSLATTLLFAQAFGLLLAFCMAPPAGAAEPTYRFTVVVSESSTAADAEAAAGEVRDRLKGAYPVRVEVHPTHFSVRVGLFDQATTALLALRRLQGLGYDKAWVGAVIFESAPPPEAAGTRTDIGSEEERPVPPPKPAELQAPPVEETTEGIAPPPQPSPSPPSPPSEPSQVAAPAEPAPPAQPAEALPQPVPLTAPPPGAEAPQIHVLPVAGSPPVLDGKLDDEVWSKAQFVSGLQQKGERRGYPSPARTEVAFLYDDQALYIGARMTAAPGTAIRAPRTRHDEAADADRIIVSLDTLRDRQTAYNFGVTAGGTRIDFYQPVDVYEVRDMSYDPVWQAKTEVEGDEWTAEMRVPFSSLEFHNAEEQVWGVNLQHVSVGERQYEFWVVVPANETGWSSRFGELVGLTGIKGGSRFSVTPFAVGVQHSHPTGVAASDQGKTEWRYGGDLEFNLASGLKVAATVQPDFGQIEADPATVNLTDYEIFFPERRPFFVEGAQLFQGTGPRYFYSRRIGAPPHADFQDEFDETGTTILGAAKLIGRTRSGWSTGTMFALTDAEEVLRGDPETGAISHIPVEPQTLYGVTRVQKDFGAGSTFGFVATGQRRDFGAGDSLSNVLARQSYAGGIDWNVRFADQTHEFGGFAGGSVVEGSPDAMLRLQGSSARYYQRPDADYVEVDPHLTRLEGYTAGLHVGRIEGAWRWSLSGEARSPGFEINDVGAMATADDLDAFGQLSWGRPFSSGAFQRVDVSLSAASGWNYGNVRQFTSPAADVSLVWHNFWRTYFRVAYDARAESDSLTRGGPLMGTGKAWHTHVGISTNDAHRTVWSADGSYFVDELDGVAWSVGTQLLLRRGKHFTFSIAPGYERATDARQYSATVPDGRPETFGQRYVFAGLDRSTVYARLRAGFALLSNLSFDLYVEPFAASGSYARFGELARPGSRDLFVYGETPGTSIVRQEDRSYLVTVGDQTFTLANPDFDLTSYRSNAVVRWDFLAGSSLYLVWTQNRVSEDTLGQPVGGAELVDSFDAPAEDIFSIKLSFRIGAS